MVIRHLLNFPFECARLVGRDRSLEVLMPLLSTYRLLSVLIALLAISCVTDSNASSQTQSSPERDNKTQACPNDDSGLTLPPGFCATVFADDIGHARHMVVAPNGVLYDAEKTNQIFSPAQRFATGIRNAEGFAIDATGRPGNAARTRPTAC